MFEKNINKKTINSFGHFKIRNSNLPFDQAQNTEPLRVVSLSNHFEFRASNFEF